MTVTITDKEFDAICEVLDQVETDYEAASNEEYLEKMSETINLVKNVIKKYKKARQKADEFQMEELTSLNATAIKVLLQDILIN